MATYLPLPIISTGITLFCVIIYVVQLYSTDLTTNWALNPSDVVQLQLNRLTTYPLIHFNPTHLVFNLLALWPVLAVFERVHGSLHTAIVLNTTGAITGVIYVLLTWIFGGDMDVYIAGASGWCFTFITVACLHKSLDSPIITLYEGISIPTAILPFCYLLLSQLLVPSSSLLGHLIGIFVGFAVYYGVLGPLTTPPFKVLEKIENWRPFLKLLSIKDLFSVEGEPLFVWIYERESVDKRYQQKLNLNTTTILPLSQTQTVNQQGQVLGSNSAKTST